MCVPSYYRPRGADSGDGHGPARYSDVPVRFQETSPCFGNRPHCGNDARFSCERAEQL